MEESEVVNLIDKAFYIQFIGNKSIRMNNNILSEYEIIQKIKYGFVLKPLL